MSALGGDHDSDDAAAEAIYTLEGSPGVWTPECWRKSPEELEEEARAMNMSAFAGVALGAGRHSNPPNPPTRLRGT